MVGKELAVENPHAREIANACSRLGLETVFEPSKSHPKDWANPGRVKIKLKGGQNKNIKNSKQAISKQGIEDQGLNPYQNTTSIP